MIRSILFPLAEGSLDEAGRHYAFWLAKREGSRVHGLALIDIKSFEFPVLGTPDGFMPSVLTPPMQESQSLRSELNTLARQRLEEFAAECQAADIPCSTDIETGIPGEIIAREAVAHDIVVLGRVGYSAGAEMRVDPLIPAVIRGSIRPVLVAGRGFKEVRRILIAYDGSIHAARALAVAAVLGARPATECTLAIVAGSEELGLEELLPAETYLCHHGVKLEKKVVVGTHASGLICELVSSTGADILIMGAYGHSPIREMIFGSTTERVLAQCGSTVILQS